MSIISKSSIAGSGAVVDAPKVLMFRLLAIFCAFAGVMTPLMCIIGRAEFGSIITLVLGIISGICFWAVLAKATFVLFKVNEQGFVIDVEKDIFEFPGGGIEAENWTSYFTLMYWTQWFRRHQLVLSEIRHLNAYRETKSRIDKQGRKHISTTNVLEIDGDFGAVRFSFWSKGKRDQLYSALVSINKMGTPIVNR